jgi:hypothetical protein
MKSPGLINFPYFGIALIIIGFFAGCDDGDDIPLNFEEFKSYFESEWQVDSVFLNDSVNVTEEFYGLVIEFEYDAINSKDNEQIFNYQVNQPNEIFENSGSVWLIPYENDDCMNETLYLVLDSAGLFTITENDENFNSNLLNFETGTDKKASNAVAKYKWKTTKAN